jgi:hypothetical protein
VSEYYLVRDIYSIVNSKRRYGAKHQKVSVIGDRAGILAVKSDTGEKFYVTREELISQLPGHKQETMEQVPVISEEKPAKKNKKSGHRAASDSMSLF